MIDMLPGLLKHALREPVLKAALYDLEQSLEERVTQELLNAVVDGSLIVGELVTDHFVRALHSRLYGKIWTWAGRHRTRETNIGIPPERIGIELRTELDNLRFRWTHTQDLTAHRLGIATHAAVVRIHPFIDGNGRTTRLLADLVFAAAQDTETLQLYDWDIDRAEYVRLLREYDYTRDPAPLATLIGTREVTE